MNSKEIIINNIKIKYIEKNSGGNLIFLFLHGWGSNYKLFFKIFDKFDNFIAFDFPGFGESSELKKEWTLSDYVRITDEFISKKISEKKIIFIAHSFGGRVLAKLLNKRRIKNVKKIICIGVPFLRVYGIKQKINFILAKIIKFILLFPPFSFFKKWARAVSYSAINASDYHELSNNIMKQTFKNIINEDILGYAQNLRLYETYFISGNNDNVVPLSHTQIVAKKIGAKLIVIKKAGHFPFIENTDEFLKEFHKIIKI